MGFAALAPVDRFLERRRIPVVVLTGLAVLSASPLLLFLPFDFNPLHLRSAKVESVATFLELRKDPQTGVNAVEIIAPNLDAANMIAHRLSELPQVSQTITLSNLVPDDQDAKLKFTKMQNSSSSAMPSAPSIHRSIQRRSNRLRPMGRTSPR
jgi:hypothetical protein